MRSLLYLAIGGGIGWWLALNKYEETKNALEKAKEKANELQQQLLSQQQENADLQEQMGDDDDIGTT